MLKRSTFFVLVFCSVAASACRPELPSPSGEGAAAASAPPHVAVEPEGSLDAAPRVLRIRIVPGEGASVDPSRVLFVRGHVGPAHVREMERGEVSAALGERAVPAVVWSDAAGALVIAPSLALDPGATYGVLSGDPALGVDVRVIEDDAVPLLSRVWPPLDAPEAGRFAIYCGASDLAEPLPRALLEPSHAAATIQRGVVPHLGSRCLRVDAGPVPVVAEPALPLVVPPLLDLVDGSQVRLAPGPLAHGAAPSAAIEPLACAAGEVTFGPGCAQIADDRLAIATPGAPLLWAVRSPVLGDELRLTKASEPWVLLGFSPGEHADLRVAAIDAAGRARVESLGFFTEPPMAHVVLSEVLANPLGAEPDQEWVELFNDGLEPASLAGYVLQDAGGSTPLPDAALAPKAFALVVNEPFVDDDGEDPVPAPGTLLLRVPKLGKGGLKNDGEPLSLKAPDGTVVSRLPAKPKPKAGQSLARLTPSAPDADAASFKLALPTPGAAN